MNTTPRPTGTLYSHGRACSNWHSTFGGPGVLVPFFISIFILGIGPSRLRLRHSDSVRTTMDFVLPHDLRCCSGYHSFLSRDADMSSNMLRKRRFAPFQSLLLPHCSPDAPATAILRSLHDTKTTCMHDSRISGRCDGYPHL
jgi:hypothetical protein